MSNAPVWRRSRPADGPLVASTQDIDALNDVFTEAFTERYRRDGLVGVRVPALNPSVWRYAIEDAGDGALYWRDERGRIVAFNIVHHSGVEGWMGPLCVRPEWQGTGLGKTIVQSGLSWLRQRAVRVIGLETMPRTMDNIGFYSKLGFVPAHMTVTLTLDAEPQAHAPHLLSRLSDVARLHAIAQCRLLTDALSPGVDFTREIELTDRLALGDTVLLGSAHVPVGFALCHAESLVEGRSRDELRVLKLVLSSRDDLPAMIAALMSYAHRAGLRRISLRVQGDYPNAYRTLMQLGARVRWTDLRMNAFGWAEVVPTAGMVLSNWEI